MLKDQEIHNVVERVLSLISVQSHSLVEQIIVKEGELLHILVNVLFEYILLILREDEGGTYIYIMCGVLKLLLNILIAWATSLARYFSPSSSFSDFLRYMLKWEMRLFSSFIGYFPVRVSPNNCLYEPNF